MLDSGAHRAPSAVKLQEDELARLLRSCRSRSAAKSIHDRLRRSQHRGSTYLCNLVVEMYGRCGSLEDARLAFDAIRAPNQFSWNILMAAYTHNGQLQAARSLFETMPTKNVIAWTTMVAAYAQRGLVVEAGSFFEKMPERNVASWNAMVMGYAKAGQVQEARKMFDLMPHRDLVSWNALVTAYGQASQLEEARQVFARMPQRDVVSWTTLVTAYARAGHLQEARSLFESTPEKNLVTWTAIIGAYNESEGGEGEALTLFKLMDLDGVRGDEMVLIMAMDACGKALALVEGRAIHDELDVTKVNVVLGTAVVNMYGKCGLPQEARAVFESMSQRTVVTWSTMVAAYGSAGDSKAAMRLVAAMDLDGEPPNEFTLSSLIDGCANAHASPADASLVHSVAAERGLDRTEVVGTALVHMYGRCGDAEAAVAAFWALRPPQRRGVVTWTAAVTACVQCGRNEDAAALFQQMQLDGVEPNDVTLLSVLCACGQSGSLKSAVNFFQSMAVDYSVPAGAGHYVCMVDLLGRAGRLADAEDLADNMPFQPHPVAWTTLMSSCRLYGDQNRGGRLASRRRLLDQDASPYVLLAALSG